MMGLRLLGYFLCALSLSGLAACSEPKDNISGTTADNQFALRLEAEKNWVRAEQDLPIRLTLESLTGAFAEQRTERIELLVNNGFVSPSSTYFTFTVADDSLGVAGDIIQSEWITFTAARSVTSAQQGEVIALFEDLQVTFKIRFVD